MGREWTPDSPEGWHADPYERHERRYWNGEIWTPYVSDQGVVGLDQPEDRSRPVPVSTHDYGPRGLGPEPAKPEPAPAPSPAVAGALTTSPATAPPSSPPGTPHWATAPRPSYNPNIPQPPSASWAPPPPPGAAWAPPGAQYPQDPGADNQMIGTPTRPFYRATWFFVLSGFLVLLLVAVGVAFAFRPQPERIHAAPAAAAPVGFRVINVDDYELAVPQAWQSREITDDGLDAMSNFAKSNGAKGDSSDFTDNLTGTKVAAADLATGESLAVFPFKALTGDPGDPETLAQIKGGFTAALGTMQGQVDGVRADVHGFPAAQMTTSVTVAGKPVHSVITIVQTGDHVYELVVASGSAARTKALSDQIVPTFDPH
jgi:hypothetical protein